MGNCKSLFGRSKACSTGVVFSADSLGAPGKSSNTTPNPRDVCWILSDGLIMFNSALFIVMRWKSRQLVWSRRTRKTIQEILLRKTCLPNYWMFTSTVTNDGIYDYTFRQWSCLQKRWYTYQVTRAVFSTNCDTTKPAEPRHNVVQVSQ